MNTIRTINKRQRTVIVTTVTSALLLAILIGGQLLSNDRIVTNLEFRNLPPSLAHPFGTDWLGRDMLTRTIKGLSISIVVGLIAAAASVTIAVGLGIIAATMGKIADAIISWLVDLFLSIPHLVML